MVGKPCDSHCEHGGVCVLDAGHDGLHDSEYCTWTDTEAIPKEDADNLLRQKMQKEGRGGEAEGLLLMEDTLRKLLDV